MVDAPSSGGTVKLPLVGATKKRSAIIFGVAAVAVAGYGYYRYTQNANSTANAPGTNVADNQIDPATGYAYGSAEDAAALQANEQYQYPAYGSGAGGSGISSTPTSSTTATVPQTNAEWSRACLNYLAKQVGDNARNVQNALGDYLTGQDVVRGSNEEALILQAIAAYGYPPQPGPKNYPPGIKYAAAPSGGGGGTKPPTTPKPALVSVHYITRKGDTPEKISAMTGNFVSWQDVLKENHLRLRGITSANQVIPTSRVIVLKMPKNKSVA